MSKNVKNSNPLKSLRRSCQLYLYNIIPICAARDSGGMECIMI